MAGGHTPTILGIAIDSQLESSVGRDQSVIARRCERAVVTAYRELRATGNADMDAFRACTTLYRIHHPEASINEARRLVSEWVDHHVIRGDTGPTPGCECADD
jgi:hypothetical protein